MYLENQIANKDIHTFSQNGVYVMEQKKRVSRSACPLRMTVAACFGGAADALLGSAFAAGVASLIFAFGAALIFCFFTKAGRACFWTRAGFVGATFLLAGTETVSFVNAG